jgi:hypothetical protein
VIYFFGPVLDPDLDMNGEENNSVNGSLQELLVQEVFSSKINEVRTHLLHTFLVIYRLPGRPVRRITFLQTCRGLLLVSVSGAAGITDSIIKIVSIYKNTITKIRLPLFFK